MIILDIDNCIADDLWRVSRIRWDLKDQFRRYENYHLLSAFDKVHNFHLYRGIEACVLTGRPVAIRATTQHWLEEIAGVKMKHLLMRNNNDARCSVLLKQGQLENLQHYYGIKISDIVAAYDDRPEIVAMYKRLGVRNAQVVAINPGHGAYLNPNTQELHV